MEASREDLVGGYEGLTPANPPREALDARRRRANEVVSGEFYHKVPATKLKQRGHRPGRKSQVRQQKPGRDRRA